MAEESQAVSKAGWKVRKGKQEAAEPRVGAGWMEVSVLASRVR